MLNGPLGAPLRRAPFTVHVAVKTVIYLGVILFGLKFGVTLFPAPGESGIESGDVLFSLAAAFVFVFILDVNSLLGQNVLINFITGRYYRPAAGIAGVPAHRHGRLDGIGRAARSARLPSPGQKLRRSISPQPIVAARGEIHRYVGDELIATWKLEEGVADGALRRGLFRRHRPTGETRA